MSDQISPYVPISAPRLAGRLDATAARAGLFVGGCTLAFLLIAGAAAYLVISAML